MEWWLGYLLLGLAAGFLAGLLGIGGGMLVVPTLVFLFSAQHFDASRVMHLALGTSLASIVATSLTSTLSHHRLGHVLWPVWRRSVIGALLGTLAGTALADRLPAHYLAALFVAFTIYCALQMVMNRQPPPSRQLPGTAGLGLAGLALGGLSSLVGAGGGLIAVPLLSYCNVPLRQAIGTSAAFGLPVSLAGSLGYLLHGLSKDRLPPGAVGYIYLPAVVCILLGALVTVPLGARACHFLPVARLRLIFAALLLAAAGRMLASLL